MNISMINTESLSLCDPDPIPLWCSG